MMKTIKSCVKQIHPAAEDYASDVRNGHMDRREFLTRVSALGLSVPAAYGLLDLAVPPARAATEGTPVMGGTLRMQMETRASKDPRTADWSQIANFTRGWLEYLLEYEADGSLRGMLLESWAMNDSATECTLKIRPGITWSNGDPFSVEDIVFNLNRWCDGTVAGNSMAARMAALIDPDTHLAREGAIVLVDAMTVKLVLDRPDISIMIGMADYPAAVMHPSYDGGDPSINPIGTGPYLPETNEPGIKQVLVKNADQPWWGTGVYGGPFLDRIEYIDLGVDPFRTLTASAAGEIEATYQTTGDFIQVFDELGWTNSTVESAATMVVRFNQRIDTFADVRVRRALSMAVDNAVVLELGYGGHGTIAENHHVCPIHPEYAKLPALMADPQAAKALLTEAGYGDFVFELVSVDDAWQAATCDAVAVQLGDAGISVTRTVLPAAEFLPNWRTYAFSGTEWNMRPLGVQILSLAYRSGEDWNETGFSNAEFDGLLAKANSLLNVDERRMVMKRIEEIMQEQGVIIQAYWRNLTRHSDPRVKGAEMHPMFEHHHYKWWMEA